MDMVFFLGMHMQLDRFLGVFVFLFLRGDFFLGGNFFLEPCCTSSLSTSRKGMLIFFHDARSR